VTKPTERLRLDAIVPDHDAEVLEGGLDGLQLGVGRVAIFLGSGSAHVVQQFQRAPSQNPADSNDPACPDPRNDRFTQDNSPSSPSSAAPYHSRLHWRDSESHSSRHELRPFANGPAPAQQDR